MKSILAAFEVAAIIGITAAFAAPTNAPNPGCFDVTQPLAGGPEGSFMLDRCTGKSWLLVKGLSHDATNNGTAPLDSYVWHPIEISDRPARFSHTP